MLELRGVSKVYRIGTFGGKTLPAVRDVSFAVGDGQIVSLIGESGSGKSTIGKMILRLVPITAGSVLFNGFDVSTLGGAALKEYRRKVQGVFQDPFSSYNPIFKADRIFKIIRQEFFPAMSGRAWNDKLEGALRAVGLNPEHVLDKYPHQLSGGQLQRFLIARALLLDIEFLVADEIISMLDASTRIDVLNLLAELKSRGLAVLFVTHDLSLGYYVSDRAVILYQGQVVEMGATGQVYQHPVHPYTRMLMASVPRLDKKWEEVAVELRGQQTLVSQGCAYFPRCSLPGKGSDCAKRSPPLIEVESGHLVACSHPAAD